MRWTLLAPLLFLPLAPLCADVDVRKADLEMYPSNATYDTSIPTPASVLGP